MGAITLRFFHSNRGSIAIDFSLIIILFIFMLLFSAEIARLLYISASLDLAVSEAAKSAKNKERSDNNSYSSILRQRLISHQGVLGSFITEDNLSISNVLFSRNIPGVINRDISGDNTYPLATYSISYLYQPAFFPISSLWASSLLSREVVFVQEN
ncbi:TadE/TadG family type IV pilus assembly protein [Yersinia hibernica]|uniref:Pilus assembly protein n=2 Tax=Yersinia TaxID=629 RepID=A0ABX5R4U3_9GAMM|nr:TadE/TadG family type IV pilus assembly protein [Yersinia hibernica]AHM72024.1 tight adherance operon protein [Yersinia hibernica]OVZ94331.1 tight adherance operon protein [Yersinia kristensenii]QAX80482.1 pilus assembly protein [Yersinia hibernica]